MPDAAVALHVDQIPGGQPALGGERAVSCAPAASVSARRASDATPGQAVGPGPRCEHRLGIEPRQQLQQAGESLADQRQIGARSR